MPAHQLSEYISQPPKNGTQPTVIASSPAISRNNLSTNKNDQTNPLLDQFQKPNFQNSSGLGVSSFADDIFDVTDAQASSSSARPGSSIYGINNMNNAMQNGNINGSVNSISNAGGTDSNMYSTLGNRSNSISISNNSHSLHNGNDEPMLDYLYPDFGLGSDLAIINSLFFVSGPSWTNSEFTASTNLQGDLGFGNGNNNM